MINHLRGTHPSGASFCRDGFAGLSSAISNLPDGLANVEFILLESNRLGDTLGVSVGADSPIVAQFTHLRKAVQQLFYLRTFWG